MTTKRPNRARPHRVPVACSPAEYAALRDGAAAAGLALGPFLLAAGLERAGATVEPPADGRTERWATFRGRVASALAECPASALPRLADAAHPGHGAALTRVAGACGLWRELTAPEAAVVVAAARERLAAAGGAA